MPLDPRQDDIPCPSHTRTCDVLVLGSGAGGLAAAVTAAWHGLNVIVAEKTPVIGGTTAWAGGWVWAPCNPLARRAGIEEDPAQARAYLQNLLGPYFEAERVDAFLQAVPEMVGFFETHTALQFSDGNAIPDMEGHLSDAATGGHQITAAPYSGHQVKDLLPMLRTTMRETSFWGMPIQAGPDLAAFLTATRSWSSLRHVVTRTTKHLYHLARYGRAMDLVNGVALVARLARSASDLGVQWQLSSPAVRLVQEDGAVCGAVLDTPQGSMLVKAKAVILATGGFGHDTERRQQLFPRDSSGKENLALPLSSCTGGGLRLGESVGGHVRTDLYSPVAWAPVSEVPYGDGTVGRFPHIIDRGKPGVIGVLANGKRFVNESHSYYQYVTAMIRQVPEDQEVCSWLVCDHAFLRRYGLGYVRPSPVPFGHHVRSGYLKRGRSLQELAHVCGIDADALVATVYQFNQDAEQGQDSLWGRGSTPYNRKQGDASMGRAGNPCVAPLEHGPFYAIKVKPGCFATFAGLDTDGMARVRNAQHQPIAGLYAVGTDMSSVFGGFYPSGGANIGPALTFGYVAGRHLASILLPQEGVVAPIKPQP